jgi:hypothetical protein
VNPIRRNAPTTRAQPSDVRCAAGRPAKKTDGLVTAETNGTASIPQASAPLACISGLQHSVSLAPAGRRILIGMLTDANPTYSI